MPRGAKVGNCNAAKNKARCRAQKGFTRTELNYLARRRSPSLTSEMHRPFTNAWAKASARYGVSGSYKFIKNVQKSVANQRLMRGI